MKRRWLLRSLRNSKVVIIVALIVSITVLTAVFGYKSNFFLGGADSISVTVAWNPGSISDDLTRALINSTDTRVSQINMPGANGATGANFVFNSAQGVDNLLSTHLSALVTSRAMGFSEFLCSDWTAWLCAFSPAIIVVADNSPYKTMNDLIADIRANPGEVRAANSGFGTISFTAAELLSLKVVLELEQISFAGSSPTVSAVLAGEADFAVLLSTDIIGQLQTGNLRAIGAFSETDFVIKNGDAQITISSVSGLDGRLDSLLPFGEYYGFFAPSGLSNSQLNKLEETIKTATAAEIFEEFIANKGLLKVPTDRRNGNEVTAAYSLLVNQTLYDAGFLPVNPS